MKKLVTTCALLTACAFASFAQSKQAATKKAEPAKQTAVKKQPSAEAVKMSVDKRAETIAKGMEKEYGLSKDQYQQVYDTQKDYLLQEDQLIQAGNTGGAMIQLGIMRDERLKRVLSQEQFVKYEVKQKAAMDQQRKSANQ